MTTETPEAAAATAAWPPLGKGPWFKRDADGIHIITPPGPQDEHGNTDHIISPERASALAHFLDLFGRDA